jgi:uncharacterized protein (TIGR00369 family)
MHDMIRDQMAKAVPFASFVGVELIEVGPGTAKAAIEPRSDIANHLGTLHAGALYTLGETASGAAVTGAFAAQMLSVRPVAAEARVRYLRLAKGRIEARASTAEPAGALLARLEADGKVRFAVEVELVDTEGAVVAGLTVEWHVSRRGS